MIYKLLLTINYLQKCKPRTASRYSGSGIPVVNGCVVKIGFPRPIKLFCPGFVAKVVANEVAIYNMNNNDNNGDKIDSIRSMRDNHESQNIIR